MPITKSARKALRQSKKRKIKNIEQKKKVRDSLKKIKNLVSEKKFKEAKALLPQAYKLLDKAAKTGLIKKGGTDRTKSRLAKLINKQV